MYPILYKYFALKKQLYLPGIGCIYLEQMPAELIAARTALSAPVPVLKFNTECGPADRKLFEFIASEKSIDEVEAIRQLQDFSYQLKQDIAAGKEVLLPYIGTLNSIDNVLSFHSLASFNKMFPDVVAERIHREDTPHNMLVGNAEKTSTEMQEYYDEEVVVTKDRWGFYALLLTLFALGLITYYYLQVVPHQVY